MTLIASACEETKLQLLQSTTRCRVRLVRPVIETPLVWLQELTKYLAFAFEDQPDLRGFR